MNKLVEVSLKKIRPYLNNPRFPKEAVEVVMKSIEKYGYNSPIIVDKDFVIISGHVRYKALLRLKWTKVRVLVSEMSEEAARGYRIIDNKTSEIASWDNDLLIPEIQAIGGLGDFSVLFDGLESFGNPHSPVDEGERKKRLDQFHRHMTVMCPKCSRTFECRRDHG